MKKSMQSILDRSYWQCCYDDPNKAGQSVDEGNVSNLTSSKYEGGKV